MEYHLPVMVEEILNYWVGNQQGNYLDGTLGGGGHSFALLERFKGQPFLYAMDRDPAAVEFAGKRLAAYSGVRIIPDRFSAVDQYIDHDVLDGALYDLGVSSRQLDDAERGFSYRFQNGPVDLRMNTESEYDAQAYIRQTSEADMGRHFHDNSDLPRGYYLAEFLKKIMNTRGTVEFSDLRDAVKTVLRAKSVDENSLLSRILQSIRMEVNQEMKEITDGFAALIPLLKKGGRICVLTYHSVEDRRVKNFFAALEKDCICDERLPVCMCGGNNRKIRKVLRKPLCASPREISENPRARSAKLRVYEKV